MKRQTLYRFVTAALCLGIALVLPFLTGQIPSVGNMLCPMHLPVLLCGFLVGGAWGAAVGLIAPILRFFLFGMPPLVPTGIAMALELAAYGLVAGWLYRKLPKTTRSVYIALIAAMIAGRLVWGAAQFVLLGMQGTEFTFSAFLAGAVLNAIPGILLQLILIPVLVRALQRARR